MLVYPGLIFYSVHNGYKYVYINFMLKLNSALSARMYCLFYNISANILLELILFLGSAYKLVPTVIAHRFQ